MSKTEIVTPDNHFISMDRKNVAERGCRIRIAKVKTANPMHTLIFLPDRVDCDVLRESLRDVAVSESDARRLGLDAYGSC